MARLLALILVLTLAACASAPRPPASVGSVPAVEEPLDPSIKPLSKELEDAGQ